jgi:hypothetical protein
MTARKKRFGGNGFRTGTPGSDLAGTVRRSPDGTMLAICWPSPPSLSRWWVADAHGSLGYEPPERIAHWPVVGAVPYSAAAGMALKTGTGE